MPCHAFPGATADAVPACDNTVTFDVRSGPIPDPPWRRTLFDSTDAWEKHDYFGHDAAEPTTVDFAADRRSAAAFDRGDIDGVLAMYRPDAVWDMSPAGMGVF
jgi:hypothetical protein